MNNFWLRGSMRLCSLVVGDVRRLVGAVVNERCEGFLLGVAKDAWIAVLALGAFC
jgi:hypothetical protein